MEETISAGFLDVQIFFLQWLWRVESAEHPLIRVENEGCVASSKAMVRSTVPGRSKSQWCEALSSKTASGVTFGGFRPSSADRWRRQKNRIFEDRKRHNRSPGKNTRPIIFFFLLWDAFKRKIRDDEGWSLGPSLLMSKCTRKQKCEKHMKIAFEGVIPKLFSTRKLKWCEALSVKIAHQGALRTFHRKSMIFGKFWSC